MKLSRFLRAAALSAAPFRLAVTLTAAPVPADHHLRSTPQNMGSGYFSAEGIHAMISKSIFKDSTATSYWNKSESNSHAFTQ